MGWIEALLGIACPGCGRGLDAAGLCTACRKALAPRRRGHLVFLGTYARWGGAVRALKYRGYREVARVLAPVLARGVHEAGWEITAVTAVPTLVWRRLRRGYNPAEVLAQAVAEVLERPYVPVLRRARYTPSQTRRAPQERANLPPDLFRAAPVRGDWLLVDDVWTSGATFARARDALARAGARRVYGAVIAVRNPKAAGLTPV
ncbi:ComF family protein [Marinithermus hydrothermalis]|uniref:Competence protein ComF n=1 Tax=Marinithermus hydrothermalis (strain DSM 14884 / JCM 11576 / T1) TaxID=869210 RepID=F2NMF0_MARHT|nr:ComF family protein [Marinithermus hydrothermalis]AEB11838.1 competence protein ComF [Marinithermus hydrothermalis DSM 14884]